jgi:hypothetical protein
MLLLGFNDIESLFIKNRIKVSTLARQSHNNSRSLRHCLTGSRYVSTVSRHMLPACIGADLLRTCLLHHDLFLFMEMVTKGNQGPVPKRAPEYTSVPDITLDVRSQTLSHVLPVLRR